MDNTRTPVLYIVGNYNIDLVMGTLTHWPAQGTEMMLEHSALRPGGSAGNCALAAAAMQLPHCAVGCQGDDAFTPWLAAQFPGGARWPQYPCETSLTVAVTHPNKERSFLSNHGHITRLTAGDVLTSCRRRWRGRYRVALRHLSLYRAAVRLSAAARHAPPARVYPCRRYRLAAPGLERPAAS
jgi:sugar/nucleoside kinase (ribokinase family)